MKLLSIDVGIRNLAICLLETSCSAPPRILKWRVLDLAPAEACCDGQPATLRRQKELFFVCRACARGHAPELVIVTPRLAKACKPPYDEPYLRKRNYIATDAKCNRSSVDAFMRSRALIPYKPPAAASIPLTRLAGALRDGLEAFLEGAGCGVDRVAIENQIGPRAIRMKTIQGMVTQHLVTSGRCSPDAVTYVSAREKLRAFPAHKGLAYGQRKLLAVRACEHVLREGGPAAQERLEEFQLNKKRDDLADAFLQGVAVAVGAACEAPRGWGSADVRIT